MPRPSHHPSWKRMPGINRADPTSPQRALSENLRSAKLPDLSAGLATVCGVAGGTCEALIRLSARVRVNCWAISSDINKRQVTVA